MRSTFARDSPTLIIAAGDVVSWFDSLAEALDAAIGHAAAGHATVVHRPAGAELDPWVIRAAERRAQSASLVAPAGRVVLTRLAAEELVGHVPTPYVLEALGRHRLADLLEPETLSLLSDVELVGRTRLASLDTVPNNLPFVLTSFVGRGAELERIADRLSAHRLVTLTGAGGCGKTRVALHAAAALSSGFDSVHLVDLAAVFAAADVVPAILRAFADDDVVVSVPDLIHRLGDGRHLVVLDNCEHLVSAVAEVALDLLARVGGLRILVTSREPLAVGGEAVVHLQPLDLSSDAVELFVERARLVRSDFGASSEVAATVAEICGRLDGIPLAIEMAAALVGSISPDDVLRGLTDRFRMLSGGPRRSLGRHQTLHASVDWSYRLLGDDAQRALRCLSVFAGSFDLRAAEAVIDADGADRYQALPLLTALADRSLVVSQTAAGPTRYRLLESVRQFAAERLGETDRADLVRRAHAHHYAGVVDMAADGMDAERPDRWTRLIDADIANITAAFDWFVDGADDVEAAWSMCGALTLYWGATANLRQARSWFRRCHECGEPPSGRHLRARWGEAYLAIYTGDLAKSAAAAAAALELAEAVGDTKYAARALDTLATVAISTMARDALDLAERAVELAQRADDPWCEADASQIAGYACLRDLDPLGAQVWLDRALPLARRLDHPQLLAWDRLGRADVLRLTGRPVDALAMLDDADAQLSRATDPNLVGMVAASRARSRLAIGDDDGLVDTVRGALANAREAGGQLAAHALQLALAAVQLASGDLDGCAARCAEQVEVFEELGAAGVIELLCIATGAELARTPPDHEQAAALVARARRHLHGRRTSTQAAVVDVAAGAVALATHDLPTALTALRRALPVLQRAGLVAHVLDAVELVAGAVVDADPVLAGRLSGASSEHRSRATSAAASMSLSLSIEELVAAATAGGPGAARAVSGWASLTPTERRVVDLALTGLSNREIGVRLFVSAGTVKTHLAHVFAKLHVANRTELATLAANNR